MQQITLGLAQINSRVGDIQGNLQKICSQIISAKEKGANVIIFPELALTGYPPEDLLFQPDFVNEVTAAINEIAKLSVGIVVVLGAISYQAKKIFNSALWLQDAKIRACYNKQKLPNYGVFDEFRYFSAGAEPVIIEFQSFHFALAICEDLWYEATYSEIKKKSQTNSLTILGLNASPFSKKKLSDRHATVGQFCKSYGLNCIYLNMVGGQDEIVFDGGSFCINHKGLIEFSIKEFKESTEFTKLEISDRKIKFNGPAKPKKSLSNLEKIYKAIVLAIHDYVKKCGFEKVILGLSGGIDSAVTLCLAVDALGSKNVEAVMMPFTFTSDQSIADARNQADKLGITLEEIPITQIYQGFAKELTGKLNDLSGITQENLQSRIRGTLLMAIANKKNYLVLTTGNKSELAVGYSTLYGDMAGAFSPLKDVLKTEVYQLARFINQKKDLIPTSVLTRAPSAELSPNQKDQDTLPEYEVLDSIIEQYVENQKSIEDLINFGINPEDVKKVVNLIYKAEYKRRQAAIGPKISSLSFMKDRRYPIASGFQG